jgi:hypothetical protein
VKLSAHATVVITVEVDAVGSYGTDWKLSDLHEQVAREAEDAVRHHLKDMRVRVIGDPRVKTCTYETQKISSTT